MFLSPPAQARFDPYTVRSYWIGVAGSGSDPYQSIERVRVHCRRNRQEACDRSHEQRVVLEPKQHDKSVEYSIVKTTSARTLACRLANIHPAFVDSRITVAAPAMRNPRSNPIRSAIESSSR